MPRSSASNAGATVRLTSGTAERDGTELALNHTYTFPRNTKSKLLTYTGATLEVSGECVDRVAQYNTPEESPQLQVLNLHFALQELRDAAAANTNASTNANHINHSVGGNNDKHGDGGGSKPPGPRVMICGEKDSGKTTTTRTLAALATRIGEQPLVASVDPREGMLALPGTVSAAVFGTIMDVEDPAAGFGVSGTPSSGPSAVPVKLPMVYYFGRERVDENVRLWKQLVGKLGSSVRAKLEANEVVRKAGLVLDTPAASVAKGDLEVLEHLVNEFDGGLPDPGYDPGWQRLIVDSECCGCFGLAGHSCRASAPPRVSENGIRREHHPHFPRKIRRRSRARQRLDEVYFRRGHQGVLFR